MKALVITIIALSSFSVFAAKMNVSAQGSETCKAAIELYADLIFGKSNPSVGVISKKLVNGSCDGESCNPNSQDFQVTSKAGRYTKILNISTVGPDSSDRCDLQVARFQL